MLLHLGVALHPRSEALLEHLATALRDVTLDDWERTSLPDGGEHLVLRQVWRTLDDIWHHAEGEGGAEEGPALMREEILRVLAELRDEMLGKVDALGRGRDALAAQRPIDVWPLVYQGQSREIHAEAIAQITDRTGIPAFEMLRPEDIEDEPLFLLEDDAYAIEDLHGLLARRLAWSRALYGLRDLLVLEHRH